MPTTRSASKRLDVPKKDEQPEEVVEGPTPALQDLSFTLRIETTNTAPQQGILLNRFEEPDSDIASLNASPLQRYDESVDELIELTPDEQAKPGYVGKTLVLESVKETRDGRIVSTTREVYKNDKGFFTMAEVVALIVEPRAPFARRTPLCVPETAPPR